MLKLRNRRAIRNKHLDLRVAQVATSTATDSYNLKWASAGDNPPTAAWSHKGNIHEIIINIFCDETADKGRNVKINAHGLAMHRHEWEHSIQTERDFKAMNEALAKIKCPFTLLNLFEDARIEFIARKRDGKFGWKNWYVPTPNPADPMNLLYCLICIEPEKASRFPLRGDLKTAFNSINGRAVAAFYEQIVCCKSTMDLLPILVNWLKAFPQKYHSCKQPEDGSRGKGVHGEDYHASCEVAGEVMPADTIPQMTDDESKEKSKTLAAGGTGSLTSATTWKDELLEGRRLGNRLRQCFKNKIGKGRQKTPSPTRRLRMREISTGLPINPYTTIKPRNRGCPNISIVMDCSGSMSGEYTDCNGKTRKHDESGRILLHALSDLAKQGLVEGRVYLSANSCVNTQRGCFHQFDLSTATKRDIDRSNGAGGGSEGIDVTVAQNIARMSKSRIMLVFTDACWGGLALKPEEMHGKGIFTVGLYAGSTDRSKHLAEIGMDQSISTESVESLAESLARRLAAV
jgi:hypothetical protein